MLNQIEEGSLLLYHAQIENVSRSLAEMPMKGLDVDIQKPRKISSTCSVKTSSEPQLVSLPPEYIPTMFKGVCVSLELFPVRDIRHRLVFSWLTRPGLG
jgi:hypothetical protein